MYTEYTPYRPDPIAILDYSVELNGAHKSDKQQAGAGGQHQRVDCCAVSSSLVLSVTGMGLVHHVSSPRSGSTQSAR
jgi:hypothetical protein